MRINVDTGELEALLGRLQAADGEKCIEAGMKVLAQRGVDVAKKNTPVGETGDLRRAWKVKEATGLKAVLINNVKYAEYVEYGHRQQVGRYVPKLGKRLKRPWVRGQFYAQKSSETIRKNAKKIMEPIITKEVDKIING